MSTLLKGDSSGEDRQTGLVLALLRAVLGEALLAFYQHGSTVSGGLQPQSDLDLLAVVRRGLSREERRQLVAALLEISSRYPAEQRERRCLEVIVFGRDDLAGSGVSIRAELVYGEWLREKLETGAETLPGADPEYTLLLVQARREAVALIGPPARELLPEVAPRHLRAALREVLPTLMAGVAGDERNVLLTLARIWYTATTGAFAPKDVAAAWALPRLKALPEAALLEVAREEYLGHRVEDWSQRGPEVQRLAERLREEALLALV